MTDQRDTMNALRELKEEYHIGSQNAWNYIKFRRLTDSLASRVGAELEARGTPCLFKRRQVANICTQIGYEINTLFEEMRNFCREDYSAAIAEGIKFDVLRIPYVRQFFPEDETQAEDDRHMEEWVNEENAGLQSDKLVREVLEFEYERFCIDAYTAAHQLGSIKAGYHAALRTFLRGDRDYLRNSTGALKSLKDILSREFYADLVRPAVVQEFMDVIDEEADDDAGADPIGEMGAAAMSRLELFTGYALFVAGDDHALDETYVRREKFDLDHIPSLEFQYLYDVKGLYERADLEHTLYQQETQRRIILNYVIPLYDMKSDKTPDALIEDLRAHLKRNIQHDRKRVLDHIELRKQGHDQYAELMIKKDQEILRKNAYLLRALASNEDWLERILES